MALVRDHLKRIGKKPSCFFGESTDCGANYRTGVPRSYVSKYDKSATCIVSKEERAIAIARDSSRQIRSGLRCCFSDETADCSASHHPSYIEAAKIEIKKTKENSSSKTECNRKISPMNNLLTDIWAEIAAEKETAIRRARESFLMALQDLHYTSPRKYIQ